MDLRTYLIGKKIDAERFAAQEPGRFCEFEEHFSQMHPNSFTAQKLFLINKLRHLYKLEQAPETTATSKPKAAKPRVVRKPKASK
ncbi:hypothetical protein C7460_101513 [Marinoscillum furvescens DSM 4134]|uniref:Uncharacterized protein n=1 Tax=Marinoscillum furvescens DSM 4134 TaxID=1122208 RepID=A0A3D9LHK9_MARFU|nr:hypothetical protein C7460_101513 [Marinoscillum furvescens DSM 4134]